MIIVFGWEKTAEPVGFIGKLYCHDCRSNTEWYVWRESEWVTFFDIRTMKFLSKHYLTCDQCGDELCLRRSEFRKIDRTMRRRDTVEGTRVHGLLSHRIEDVQMAEKTELQRKFIRASLDAERDLSDRLERPPDEPDR